MDGDHEMSIPKQETNKIIKAEKQLEILWKNEYELEQVTVQSEAELKLRLNLGAACRALVPQ